MIGSLEKYYGGFQRRKEYEQLTYKPLRICITVQIDTRVRTCEEDTEPFKITMGLYQGSALSPYLFALVIDELTKHIQIEVSWCMLFADDIVLVDETKEGVNTKLELW